MVLSLDKNSLKCIIMNTVRMWKTRVEKNVGKKTETKQSAGIYSPLCQRMIQSFKLHRKKIKCKKLLSFTVRSIRPTSSYRYLPTYLGLENISSNNLIDTYIKDSKMQSYYAFPK